MNYSTETDSCSIQNFAVAWLNLTVNESNFEEKNSLEKLYNTIHNVMFFTDVDLCIDYITEIRHQKIFLVLSCTIAQHLLPVIHNISQLDTIYIFCFYQCNHEQLMKQYPQIKGIFLENNVICKALERAAKYYDQNSISFSVVSDKDARYKGLNELDPSFMYTQLFKEIILEIQYDEQAIKELTNYWRQQLEDNDYTCKRINQFEQEYYQHSPIWWYTYENLLYETLNCSLRTLDVNAIMKLSFFLKDLHHHIERLYSEQVNQFKRQTFTVYRGQGISLKDFEQLMKAKGGLLAFNNFLSTTTDRDISIFRAESNQENFELIGIHFEIEINPSIYSTSFASLNNVSYYENQESEILFSMHTVFRIGDIKPINNNTRLWKVNLVLTADNDNALCILTERLRKEILGDEDRWCQLAMLLITLGQFDKVEKLYTYLLNQPAGYRRVGLYNNLAIVYSELGNNQTGVLFFEKVLKIALKTLPPNHLAIADYSTSLGLNYTRIGQHSKALSLLENALEIREKTLSEYHQKVAESYANISVVYGETHEYSKALSCDEKVLNISKKILPVNHPSLAVCYNNLGVTYECMNEHAKALSAHEKALEIRQKSRPSNHPDFAQSYMNMGLVYQGMKQNAKALSYMNKSLEIYTIIYPANHYDTAASFANIGLVYTSMTDYSKALLSYEKALDIFKQILPSNHSTLAGVYNNIGLTLENLGEYSKALLYYEQALEIFQQICSPNHHLLTNLYMRIGTTCCKIDDYQHAFEMIKRLFPSDHPQVKHIESLLQMGQGFLSKK